VIRVYSRADGISWDRSEALRGLAAAMPGALVVALGDVGLGSALALGTLCVALLGVPPNRSARAQLFAGGVLYAGGYALGTIVVAWPVVAIVALAAAAYAAVVNAYRGALARLLPALVVPAFALGMNHPAPPGLLLAVVFLAASLWTTIVTVLWPAAPAHVASAPVYGAAPPRPSLDARVYGALFAIAGAAGLAIGFAAGFVHVAWTAGAALLIMRPTPDLTARRSAERVAATFLGITAAAVAVRLDPTSIAISVVVAASVAAIIGTRTSAWYLSSAGTGLVVLLMSGVSTSGSFAETYAERLVETATGAALAMIFGVLVPRLIWARRPQSSVRGDPRRP
jgi:hypothetical protein